MIWGDIDLKVDLITINTIVSQIIYVKKRETYLDYQRGDQGERFGSTGI